MAAEAIVIRLPSYRVALSSLKSVRVGRRVDIIAHRVPTRAQVVPALVIRFIVGVGRHHCQRPQRLATFYVGPLHFIFQPFDFIIWRTKAQSLPRRPLHVERRRFHVIGSSRPYFQRVHELWRQVQSVLKCNAS